MMDRVQTLQVCCVCKSCRKIPNSLNILCIYLREKGHYLKQFILIKVWGWFDHQNKYMNGKKKIGSGVLMWQHKVLTLHNTSCHAILLNVF